MITLNKETRALINQIDGQLNELKDLIQAQVDEAYNDDGEEPSDTQDSFGEHIDDMQGSISCLQEEQGWI